MCVLFRAILIALLWKLDGQEGSYPADLVRLRKLEQGSFRRNDKPQGAITRGNLTKFSVKNR
ncbi:hypothetical protein B7994_03945 [Fibrobacter sp. UWR2]|nr:hypothetical protein B7994_03945 [Fibrobacter sp. UWR2]